MYSTNKKKPAIEQLPAELFYSEAVNSRRFTTLLDDFMRSQQATCASKAFYYANYPFLYTEELKQKIFKAHCKKEQERTISRSPYKYFPMQVSREGMVAQVIDEIKLAEGRHLMLPLQVHFIAEEVIFIHINHFVVVTTYTHSPHVELPACHLQMFL